MIRGLTGKYWIHWSYWVWSRLKKVLMSVRDCVGKTMMSLTVHNWFQFPLRKRHIYTSMYLLWSLRKYNRLGESYSLSTLGCIAAERKKAHSLLGDVPWNRWNCRAEEYRDRKWYLPSGHTSFSWYHK